jgi:hypothetical protein
MEQESVSPRVIGLWVLAGTVFSATPVILSRLIPALPRPPAFAIGFLIGGYVLYPIARSDYAKRYNRDLSLWGFFPYPFAGAVLGMVLMGLLGG